MRNCFGYALHCQEVLNVHLASKLQDASEQLFALKMKDEKLEDCSDIILSTARRACSEIELQQDSNEVLKSFVYGILKSSDSIDDTSVTNQKIDAFVIQILQEEVTNFSHSITGNVTNRRYNPRTMRITLGLWNRSKRGYEELRNSDVICLPHPSVYGKSRAKCE